MTDIELYNDLLNNFSDEEQEDNNDGVLYCCYANAHYEKKEYNEMIKYYIMAIERNNINAMIKMGQYYHKICYNFKESKKYYLMAINNNNIEGMAYLTLLYCDLLEMNSLSDSFKIMIDINRDQDELTKEFGDIVKSYMSKYEKMKKYYQIYSANDTDIKRDLYGVYNKYGMTEIQMLRYVDTYSKLLDNRINHYSVQQKYDRMKEFCKLAIKYDKSGRGMYMLGDYYLKQEKNYEKMKKYMLMSIKKGYVVYGILSEHQLFNYYYTNLSQSVVNDAISISVTIKRCDRELYFLMKAIYQDYIIDRKINYYSLQKYFECFNISKSITITLRKLMDIHRIFVNYNVIMSLLQCNKMLKLQKNILLYIIYFLCKK